MKRLAIALALAIVAALAVLATPIRAAVTRPFTTPALITNPIVQRGCVIRYDTKNAAGTAVIPRIHEDAGHICVGVTDLALDANGDLLINNVGGPWKIVGAWITVDESLAAQGLTCGISGGGTVSLVRCYNRSGVRVRHDSLTMYGPGNNLWFGALNWVG